MRKFLLALLFAVSLVVPFYPAASHGTVSTCNPCRNQYTATASQTVFPYTFRILDKAHIQVIVDGVTKTVDTDYSVSNVGVATGGNITFGTGLNAGQVVTLLRNVPINQLTSYSTGKTLSAKQIESDFDKQTMINQEQAEQNARTITVPQTSTATGVTIPDVNASANFGQYIKVKNAGGGLDVGTGGGGGTTTITVANGGTSQGTATGINCTGAGISCSVVSSVAQLSVAGGGGATATAVQQLATASLPTTAGAVARVTDGFAAGALTMGDGTNATCLELKSLAVYVPSCPPWNLKGDASTDDGAKWATFIAAVPNGAVVWLPHGFQSATTATIDLSGKKDIKFFGAVAGSGSASTLGQPTLKWTGLAGGTLVLCSPCQNIVFDGIFFDLNDGADFGFQALYNASPTYGVKFVNDTFHRGATGARTGAILLDWCGTGATSNCEQLNVTGSYFVGAGMGSTSIAIRIGHSNARENIISGNNITYNHQGLWINGKSTIGPNLYDHNDIDIQAAASEPLTISGGATENGKQFFNGYAGGLKMEGILFGSHDPTPAACWIAIPAGHGETTLDFSLNQFGNSDALVPFCTGPSSKLDSHDNWYSASVASSHTIPSMANFGTGYSTSGDQYYGGLVSPARSLGSTFQETLNFYNAGNSVAAYDYSGISGNVTRTITVPNANSTYVVPDTGATHNFLTAISAAGAISKAQPGAADLSDGLSGSGHVVMDTAPTVSSPTINAAVSQGSGLKHQRVTTGSIAASTASAVTFTWTAAFADANYTPQCSVTEAGADNNTLRVHHIESVTAAALVVVVYNDNTTTAKTGTLNCIAMHD